MERLKVGDLVQVIAGKDKGKQGQVKAILKDEGRVIVEGVNLVKKHQRPNPMKGEAGGIVDKAMPIDQSNVMLFNPATGKGDRVGFKVLEDGRKVRVFRSNGEMVKA